MGPELNWLDWNVNELKHELELEDMKRTIDNLGSINFNSTLQAFPRFVELLTSYSLDNQKYFRGKGVSIYYVLTFVSSNPFWCIPWVIWKVQKI